MIKVLIAEDNAVNRELLRELLELRGYSVLEACDGQEALHMIEQAQPELLLLDIGMPVMDGFEVIRHVRQEATLRDLPILVMTGKSLTPEESALLGRETQALLQKNGFWQQQLIAEVGRVIEGRKLAKSAGQS